MAPNTADGVFPREVAHDRRIAVVFRPVSVTTPVFFRTIALQLPTGDERDWQNPTYAPVIRER